MHRYILTRPQARMSVFPDTHVKTRKIPDRGAWGAQSVTDKLLISAQLLISGS